MNTIYMYMSRCLEPCSPAVGVILEEQEQNKSNNKEEDRHNSRSHWNTD